MLTLNKKEYSLISFVSLIITIILNAFTYLIYVGYIVRLVLVKVIKLGRTPVSISLTTDTLVVAP